MGMKKMLGVMAAAALTGIPTNFIGGGLGDNSRLNPTQWKRKKMKKKHRHSPMHRRSRGA
jgi:hypothetical protein